ncbi:Forkhead box protein P1-B,Forkhead box protein P4,Forkhead box protein P2,Forkhead box protein P1 [Lepeophtheirus salmonis]|uniref:Forkhead box protein P1-B,Forkhead box protein P4,Forkhead box protein P2,Forkhead box protein P1 n=1 Tax=Lepeophtheirus salmonis TaxID=72036 RepID=A0A7R8CHT1_LEPSM|nr:Forkhead box protein P1-B,Forkhead box protein P4,Forkhead box protein P2,Forkhead box protein P1 [Lepeophtheirus salmonis]CAF2821840.1 Forkhead box protein P1-B,Forkhead box protein P4,Forkhead box protein P2,Forkhead box protein P1 [Lepeophtheirus salmonis]
MDVLDNSNEEQSNSLLKALKTTSSSSRNGSGCGGDSDIEETHANGDRDSSPSSLPPTTTSSSSSPNAHPPVPVSYSQFVPPPHPPLFPPGLQQMQQLLQNQLGGFSPAQLQQFVAQHQQQQQDAGRKQLEAFLQQLQEQLQINILQQTHLMQTGGGNGDKGGFGRPNPGQAAALQQLQIQQQHDSLPLAANTVLQLTPSAFQLPNFQQQIRKEEFNIIDRVNSWKENGEQIKSPSPKPPPPSSKSLLKCSEPKDDFGSCPPPPPLGLLPPLLDPRAVSQQHPLFSHGTCRWTGCDTQCEDLSTFLKHISSDHILDDKSTAQARVQMQIVSQLELQLQKERERLQAMMAHLHLSKEVDLKSHNHGVNNSVNNGHNNCVSNISGSVNSLSSKSGPPPSSAVALNNGKRENQSKTPPKSSNTKSSSSSSSNNNPNSLSAAFPSGPYPSLSLRDGVSHPNPLSALSVAARSPSLPTSAVTSMTANSISGPIRRRISDKAPIPMNMPYMLDRAGLDIAQEIYRNRDFYRSQDVRPPFTYASLIRQAIIESPHNRLSLFSTTWKNAVRHNLSLHKCFMRVENVKGAVWTVDEVEYHRRRPQRGAAASTGGSVRTKSPTFPHSPNAYGDALNASLQSALGFASANESSNNNREGNHPFLNQGGIAAAAAAAAALHQQHQQNSRNSSSEHLEGALRSSSAEYLKIRNSLMCGPGSNRGIGARGDPPSGTRDEEEPDYVKRESSSPHGNDLRRLSSEDNGGGSGGYDFIAAAAAAAARAAAVNFNGNSSIPDDEEMDTDDIAVAPSENGAPKSSPELHNNNNNNIKDLSRNASSSSEEIKREKF